MADVARKSRTLFPHSLVHHVRHNLYDALGNPSFRPSLQQTFAISVISGYRFVDWLSVFGFSLDRISCLQAVFTPLRTMELDTALYHPGVRVPWFKELHKPALETPLVPLSHWLARDATRLLGSISRHHSFADRFFKIGLHDTIAFPDLLPGSIVRVKQVERARLEAKVSQQKSQSLFLVADNRGLLCAALKRISRDLFATYSKHLPFAPMEFEDGIHASILGYADLEIRPLSAMEPPLVAPSLGRFSNPSPLRPIKQPTSVGELLRAARRRSDWSFREASERTKRFAWITGESAYFCAPSFLSDCETRTGPPRRIQKVISLSSVYGLNASRVLDASGLLMENAGQLPMPEELLGLSGRRDAIEENEPPSYFFQEMQHRFGDLPLFLRDALPTLFGMRALSVRDIFWAGGTAEFTHPYLTGCAFLVVNRKRKTPRASLDSPKWAQPLYILQKRDGQYVCAACSLQNEMLILWPCLTGFPKVLQMRNGVDAEVVGKVVGAVRTLR